MLSKVFKRVQKNKLVFNFGSIQKTEKGAVQTQAASINPETAYVTPDFNKFAYVEYKKYPNHLSHFNRESPDYIPSFRDDYAQNIQTTSYNYFVKQIKENLAMQKKVHEILRKMDRPYLRGIAGVHKNIAGGLRDYDVNIKGIPKDRDELECASDFIAEAQRNENRWSDDTVFYPKYAKMTHFDVEWQKELDSRPVNKNFHPEKGYKYDVEVPYEQRYDYLADRLGHPEILGTPAERLLRLEGEVFHPNYLDQPFVKMPKPSPDASLNFEEGEVVYENTRLLEWAKFWNYSVIFGYLWCALFVPYQLMFKTHLPMQHASDGLFFPYFQRSMFFWDNNALHIPVVSGTALYATFIAMSYINNIWKDYVVKAQYSKDRELLFVTRVSPYGSTDEEVYELAHLEILPPSVRSGISQLSAMDNDGLYDCSCLNTQRSLLFYADNKYWNPSERKGFFDKTLNLFTEDYNGQSKRLNELEAEAYQGLFTTNSNPKLEAKTN